MVLTKENAALSACLEAAQPIAPSDPPMDARAARLKTFEREQLIIDFLNRGVSVAEIAARIDISEKRMRAIIRDILARRMPHPPEEFVAIQVSRLNEALLVAYSAMTGANLKAVDRVVRIVRELDRYHGAFVAAERRRPEPLCCEAPAGGTAAYGGALFCSAEFAAQDVEDLAFEQKAQYPLSPLERGEGWGEGLGRLAVVGSRPAPHPDLLPVNGEKGRFPAGDERPENPPQTSEKVDSAPGIAPDPQFSAVASGWSMLRDATLCVAPQHEGGDYPQGGDYAPAAAAGDRRPQILLQASENVESAPGFGWPADTASQSGGAPGLRLPSARPSGAGPPKVRAVLNGVMAC